MTTDGERDAHLDQKVESRDVHVAALRRSGMAPIRHSTRAALIGMLRRRASLLFGVSFVALLLLERAVLTQPPVWDGAMSVFPAAITLADSGFDLPRLLTQPGFILGGPNVHALSPVTWLAAASIWLVPRAALYPVLHIVHFGFAAWAATAVYVLSRSIVGERLAMTVWAATLVFPLFLVQAGSMYLEIPLLLSTTLAMVAWTRGRLGAASAWAALATLIKPAGLIVALALATAQMGGPRGRVRNGALLCVPSVLVAAAQLAILRSSAAIEGVPYRAFLLWKVWAYVRRIPDVIVLSAVFVLVMVLRRRGESTALGERSGIMILAFFTWFLAFYLLAPLLGHTGPVLPRYFVQLVPFLLIGTVLAARTWLPERLIAAGVIGLAVVFAFNYGGALYPATTTSEFSVVERSHEYQDLLSLHAAETALLGSLPADMPVFYSLPEHYRLEYPQMGYPGGPLVQGHNAFVESPYRKARLDDYPSEFYMLFSFNGLGGEHIRSVWMQAEESPGRTVATEPIRSGVFTSTLIHVATSDE